MDSAEETFDEEIPVFQRPKNFRWNSTMVAYLIDSLYNYKAHTVYSKVCMQISSNRLLRMNRMIIIIYKRNKRVVQG